MFQLTVIEIDWLQNHQQTILQHVPKRKATELACYSARSESEKNLVISKMVEQIQSLVKLRQTELDSMQDVAHLHYLLESYLIETSLDPL